MLRGQRQLDGSLIASFAIRCSFWVSCHLRLIPGHAAGIRGYPSVRAYFPKEDIDGEVFDGEHTPEAIEAWVSSLRAPAATVKLGRNNFHARVLGPSAGLWVCATLSLLVHEFVTPSCSRLFPAYVRAWIHKSLTPCSQVVDFSAGSWCGPCTSLRQQLRKIAVKLDGIASVGIVDCDRNQDFCADMGIGESPFLRYLSSVISASRSHATRHCIIINVPGAYPALRWFGGGEPKNGEALPEYNIQQSTVLDIWSEGVLAAAATARGTRQRAGQTRRTDGNTGGGDGTDVSEKGVDWGDFEEAETAQERADNKRWRVEDSIDECAHFLHFPVAQQYFFQLWLECRRSYGQGTSETEVVLVAAGLAVAVVLVFVWVMGEDGRSEEQMRHNRPYSLQQQNSTSSERTQVATETRGGTPALSKGMTGQVAQSGDNAVRKRATVGYGVGAQAAAAADVKTD